MSSRTCTLDDVDRPPRPLRHHQPTLEAIEATYPGYETIPPEIGAEVIPDVQINVTECGTATIYVALFSEVWLRVYRPRVEG